MIEGTRSFSVEFAEEPIQFSLRRIKPDMDITTVNFLNIIRESSGLILERSPGLYEFSHRSFQDYLASLEISQFNQESLLVENIDVSWWSETIRLFSARNDATKIVRRAIELETAVSVKLAFECLAEATSAYVDPYLGQRLKTWVDKHLQSSNSLFSEYAAEIKLLQRIDADNLIQISTTTAVSPELLSYCEYQLFINEKLKENKYHQPEHWESFTYPTSEPTRDVLGIRSQDVNEFCEWLTTRKYLDHGNENIIYRPVTIAEEVYLSSLTISEGIKTADYGCWCINTASNVHTSQNLLVYGFQKEHAQELKNRTEALIQTVTRQA